MSHVGKFCVYESMLLIVVELSQLQSFNENNTCDWKSVREMKVDVIETNRQDRAYLSV